MRTTTPHRNLFLYTLLATLTLGGCALEGDEDDMLRAGKTGGEPEGDGDGEGEGEGDSDGDIGWCDDVLPPVVDDHCDAGDQLGFLNPGKKSCSGIQGGKGRWAASRLFATDHPYMNRFCRYEWHSNPGPESSPETWLLDAVAQHESECPTVAPDALPWSDALAPALRTVFRDHIDHVDDPDTATSLPAYAVDLIVVDNKVDSVVNSHSRHGETIGALAEDILCDGAPNCVRQVKYALAMSDFSNNGVVTEDPNGGAFGGRGDLAQGLERAYRTALDSHAKRVVVNFSGGWEAITGDTSITAANQMDVLVDEATGVQVGSRAIHAALVALRCAGALPVVAAGNQTPGGCELGPKLPGVWEELPGLTQTQCTDLGFPAKDKTQINHSAPGAYSPLVYSVGGIGYNSEALGNARPEGQPRMVAPGQYGVAFETNAYMEPLAGTSVSTVVVSSMAALVWSYFPDLAPDEVMRIIYAAGLELEDGNGLTRMSDYGLDGSAAIHQAGVCSALELACTEHNVSCALTCDPGSPDLTVLTDELTLLMAGSDIEHYVPPTMTEEPCLDACTGDARVMFTPPGGVLLPPLFDAFHTYLPDPTDPSCASCQLDLTGGGTTGKLIVALDPVYNNITLGGTWLKMYNADGSIDTTYLGDATALPMAPGVTYDIDISMPQLTPVSASVVMQFQGSTGPYKRVTAIPVLD